MGTPDLDPEAGTAAASQPDPNEPTGDEIRDLPWKYIGYRDLTNYIASDSDFFAARRFDRLHTRAILTLQAVLAAKEAELDRLDEKYRARDMMFVGPPSAREPLREPAGGFSDADRANIRAYWVGRLGPEAGAMYGTIEHMDNGSARCDVPERKVLIAEIAKLLDKYDTLLLNYSRLRERPRASKWNVRNVENWFDNNPDTICEEEAAFVTHRDDLLTLHEEKPVTRRFFEQKIVFRTGKALGLFRKDAPATIVSGRDRELVYMYSDEAIDRFSFVALLFTTLGMLVAPLWILQALGDVRVKLGVITVFAIVWLTFFSFTTGQGRPFEKMAATAGYLAVLVVFLQFGDNQGSQGSVQPSSGNVGA